MNKLKNIFLSLVMGVLIIVPVIASAQTETTEATNPTPANKMTDRLQMVAGESGFQTGESASVTTIIGTVINVALGFLGSIFLILMIFSGYRWMTAAGNEDAIKKSKETIKQAIIGLIIVLSSWSIWSLILQRFIIGS